MFFDSANSSFGPGNLNRRKSCQPEAIGPHVLGPVAVAGMAIEIDVERAAVGADLDAIGSGWDVGVRFLEGASQEGDHLAPARSDLVLDHRSPAPRRLAVGARQVIDEALVRRENA